MRATQFVRRGLIAFAAVATLSAGFVGAAGAQAVIDGDDAIVWDPIPGYTYDVVHTDGERTAILALGGAGSPITRWLFASRLTSTALRS